MAKETIEILTEGGKASAGPPLGPACGMLKVNAAKVVEDVNKKTEAFKGMQVPVKIIVDTETKDYVIKVGSPPVTSMIRKEMNAKKLLYFKDGNRFEPGSISLEAIIKIAKSKDAIAGDTKAKVKQVLGTCLSAGVKVNDKDPRDIQKEIDEGKVKIE